MRIGGPKAFFVVLGGGGGHVAKARTSNPRTTQKSHLAPSIMNSTSWSSRKFLPAFRKFQFLNSKQSYFHLASVLVTTTSQFSKGK